nr:ATP phosphoribosyltransferase regulatory subunit [Acholeplasmatales bacterium]
GKLNFLQSLIDELKGLKSADILEGLKELYNELLKVGLQNKVVFDFSIYSYASYYTGVCFQVFADGIGKAVITGGRCDNLLKTFGIDLPAIGFGLNIDSTTDYIIANNLITINNTRYVSFTDSVSHEYALKENDILRDKGIIVEVSMFDTLDETIKYAKANGITKVLEYKNNKLNEIEVA